MVDRSFLEYLLRPAALYRARSDGDTLYVKIRLVLLNFEVVLYVDMSSFGDNWVDPLRIT